MKTSIPFILLFFLSKAASFGQTNLPYYISQAKANSPLIRDNKNQAEANQIEMERIKALYTKPQLTFNAALAVSPIINRDNGGNRFELSPADAVNYSGYDIAASNGGVYQGMFNITQPLFNTSKLRLASDQVLVAGQINQNTIKLNEHDLEKLVGDQYILCLQDLRQTAYVEQLAQLISEQRSVVGKLAEGGLLKQSDMLLVSIEQQAQLNVLAMYKATYRRDLMDLNILCGINDTAVVTIQDLDLALNAAPSQSNYYEKFRLDSLGLLALQKSFELKYKPQLSTFANAGLNGVYVPTLPNRLGASAGINFSVFIFDGRQKYLNRKRTQLLINSTQGYKSNFITQNTVRKNRVLAELASLNERIALSAGQIRDYGALLDFYKKELITGQQSVTLYITTVKNFAALQRDYVLMQAGRQLLINTYNYWNW